MEEIGVLESCLNQKWRGKWSLKESLNLLPSSLSSGATMTPIVYFFLSFLDVVMTGRFLYIYFGCPDLHCST